jgi:hypothetical protein
MAAQNIQVNDRQLACARINSQEGQDYLAAMVRPLSPHEAPCGALGTRDSLVLLTLHVAMGLNADTRVLRFHFRCSLTTR